MTGPAHTDQPPRDPRGPALALCLALALHVGFGAVVEGSDVRQLFTPAARTPIEVVRLPPPPAPPAEPAPPAPEPPPPTPSKKPPPSTPREPPPSTPEPPPAPPSTPEPPATTAPTTTPPSTSPPESVMRLPQGPRTLGRVLGEGTPGLGPSLAALEGALDVRADGPVGDSAAAARAAKRALQEDLADDAVSAGLADDYFRTLKGHVVTAWKPEVKQLNDGGESTTQLGMMRSLGTDTAAWGEMWLAYMDLAKQYANGVQPNIEPARRERLRELMRSRKGAFRVHAISEVKLTQGPDGAVLTLELPLGSGHPNVDDGVRDAITSAVLAMAEPPPARLTHGRSFSSWWRLRATWTMVPPTAFLTGAGFDITPKGFTVDVPFDIKLTTQVMLLRTDGRTSVAGDAAE